MKQTKHVIVHDESGHVIMFNMPQKSLYQERHFKDKCFYNTTETTLNKLTNIFYRILDVRERLILTNNDKIDFKAKWKKYHYSIPES